MNHDFFLPLRDGQCEALGKKRNAKKAKRKRRREEREYHFDIRTDKIANKRLFFITLLLLYFIFCLRYFLIFILFCLQRMKERNCEKDERRSLYVVVALCSFIVGAIWGHWSRFALARRGRSFGADSFLLALLLLEHLLGDVLECRVRNLFYMYAPC